MKLLLLCGSVRDGSTNAAVLRTAHEVAPAGVEATYYEGLATLPHFNPDADRDPLPPAVVEMRGAIRDADALFICTPEYAGDMPGAFKNLLDWTVGGMETEQKPVAWINASGSPGGAAGTHRMLRVVLTYTGCEIVDDACAEIAVGRGAIRDGVVSDPAIRAEIAARVSALRAHVAR
jgi:chromate reductase, NAD(P)H dehydrogenase (quinone)